MIKRFWEIDALRGIAVCLMIASNAITDVQYFTKYSNDAALWFWLARITASLFLLLAGVSLALSYAKGRDFAHYLKRGAWIFLWGMAVTAVTWLFIGKDAVLFGVLHLIGLSVIISYPVMNKKWLSLPAGIAAIIAGLLISGISFDFPWLLWLGLTPAGYYSVDYIPLLPWFGLILVGVFLGNVFYSKKKPGEMPKNSAARFAAFLGRHSLAIYLAHQPVILLALHALGIIRLFQ